MARGDHIYIHSTTSSGIPFQHHAIDMGDGTVIHLAPETGLPFAIYDESENFSVRRDPFEKFAGEAEVHTFEHVTSLPVDQVVANAESKIGESGYHLLDKNCEHFATWCATGIASSQQIEMSEATVSAVTSMAAKAFWSASSKLGSRFALRSAMKVHPAACLADGVELVALTAGCRAGMAPEESRRVAKISGTVAAAGIGTILGGPAGAVAGVALHTSSGAVADGFCKAIRNYLKR